MINGLMQGKKGLIMGLANDYSLAYGITKFLAQAGAELAFSFPNEAIKRRVEPIAEKFGSSLLFECDVSEEDHIQKMLEELGKTWGTIDFIVHSLAFSDKDELNGPYYETSRGNFLNALDISCYSFTNVCKHAKPFMKEGSACLTLTYYGAEKVMPNYNVMGIAKSALECSVKYLANDMGPDGVRVNAISAGPVKTLAAMGINDFKSMLAYHQTNAPLRRNTTLDDVGGAALYLLSSLSSGVTGEVHHVDCGYNILGMGKLV